MKVVETLLLNIVFYRQPCLKVDSAWITYNKPKNPELANEYAGFLMALGLNGHLTKLATLNIHDYLTKVQTCVHTVCNIVMFRWRKRKHVIFITLRKKIMINACFFSFFSFLNDAFTVDDSLNYCSLAHHTHKYARPTHIFLKLTVHVSCKPASESGDQSERNWAL